jgi:hypothetical protein
LLVDIAPEPAFVGLGGGDDRVAGGVEVFGCVAVLRGIAAADVAAFKAGAEVDPGVAKGYALLADMDFWGDVVGVGEVFAERHTTGSLALASMKGVAAAFDGMKRMLSNRMLASQVRGGRSDVLQAG